MKAKLVPLYFKEGRDEEFDIQLNALKRMLEDVAEFEQPIAVGEALPDVDAVIFPQLIGEAYKVINDIKKIDVPILAVTSEFGTVAMWDWEIVTYLKANGLDTYAPYNLELTKKLCKTLAMKRSLKGAKFLVFQDDPGEGMQASIFKRFYWWEDECAKTMLDKFGIAIVKKSFQALGEEAKKITDEEALAMLSKKTFETEGVCQKGLASAMKMYMVIKKEVENDSSIIGAGINCLNESFYSDTTPCLAWNLLFEEKELMWACEADTMSLLTKYIIYKSLGVPLMMTNLYPFLMGMAALKHERIDKFPQVDNPENHVLVAHCGYFGLIPRCFSSKWVLKEKVLGIVDDNATAIDGRMAEGDVTLIQMHPTLEKMLVIEGELEGYQQYPNSDCLNGGIIRVDNGYVMMDKLYSHHAILAKGKLSKDVYYITKLLGIEMEEC
ncbi:hypothetical protein [Vallitalea sp.]|jgi:hypothetical protein|uniref:hypothetical protein n=1 Tax=Vallitalea sp. TaxID=1882829 RepID=UPI0025F1C3B9|nr:hypothetical protein [Vallitalea sp.]MCT4687350.1 hypothetical protein [Vallitalea sp.]